MGCAVQIHNNTDKQGTWAYHSVDGWYVATPLEHYHTHLCQVKVTKSERLTETIKFQHKNMIRTTVTHSNKILAAISYCAKVIRNLGNNEGK